MKNTLEIIDNYLEKAICDKVNVVDILDHILMTEAGAKKSRAVESQMAMVHNFIFYQISTNQFFSRYERQ